MPFVFLFLCLLNTNAFSPFLSLLIYIHRDHRQQRPKSKVEIQLLLRYTWIHMIHRHSKRQLEHGLTQATMHRANKSNTVFLQTA